MTAPYFDDGTVRLFLGDCLDVLPILPDASIDAVVCDPPYALGFMGKQWDTPGSFVERKAAATGQFDHVGGNHNPSDSADAARTRRVEGLKFQRWCEAWAVECLRVLKPGGHLLAFGAPRTYHRLAGGIEDAGFEIRDSIHWVYGQGFPKSLDVGKDKLFCQCDLGEWSYGHGELRGVRETVPDISADTAAREIPDMLTAVQRDGSRPGVGEARLQGADSQRSPATGDARLSESGLEGRRDAEAPEGQLQGSALRPLPCGVPADGAGRRIHHGAPPSDGTVGRPDAAALGSGQPQGSQSVKQCAVESGTLADECRPQAWGVRPVCGRCGKPSIPPGLGTALKPAHEPIIVARKALAGTVAANVLEHGTGALNIAGCRVGGGNRRLIARRPGGDVTGEVFARDAWSQEHMHGSVAAGETSVGRWPANLVLTHSADCGEDCVPGCPVAELDRQSGVLTSGANPVRRECTPARGADSGGASRFFPVFRYEAKASQAERPKLADGTAHSTVKPVALMSWLVRLVCPPGGTALDPFAGSGTTLEAAVIEGFNAIGVEREQAYADLCVARLSKPLQPTLFGDLEAAS